MIEQAMYFALGFCAAALIALAVLPAFWDRAMRLTRRRLEAQMAMSPEQITAARDQLRAEFAVQQRRTELQLEAALAHRHSDLSEIGRRTATIRSLEDQIAAGEQQLKALQNVISDNVVKADGLKAELASLKDTHQQLQSMHGELSERHANLSAELESINDVASERHAELLSVDTLISGLRARSRDLETMLATSRNEVSARNEALRELEIARRSLTSESVETGKRLGEAEESVAMLEAELASETTAKASLGERLGEVEARLKTVAATEVEISRALTAETKRVQALESRLSTQDKTAIGLEETIGRLRTEKNLAEGALEKARADRGRLQIELRALRPANDTSTLAETPPHPLAVQAGE